MTPKVFDRTYSELRQEVTSGRYLPGQRLQARALADALRTSTSPVINAMRQMVGEDILHYTLTDGFIIPRVTEQRLKSLYQWSRWLTTAGSIDEALRGQLGPAPETEGSAVLTATESLFQALTFTKDSAEFSRSMDNTNIRLRCTRLLEPLAFPDLDEEFGDLVECLQGMDAAASRHALDNYHRRRIDAVSRLVGLSYQEHR